MIINHFGLTCFRIQTATAALLIDPLEKNAGLELPRMQNDIILYSRAAIFAKIASDKTFIISSPGEYEIKDIFIYGLPATGEQDNGTIFFIQAEGLSIAHLGLIKNPKLTAEQTEILEDVDILMVPVGGGESLSFKQAAEIVNDLEPRLVIPMYYQLPNLKVKLEPLDKFKREIGAKAETVDKLKINKKDLPQEETKIVILQNNVA